MTNVVTFKRRNEAAKEELLAQIDELDLEKGTFLLFYDPEPEEDTKNVTFLTNMTPGMKELLMWNYVLGVLEDSAFDFEEE